MTAVLLAMSLILQSLATRGASHHRRSISAPSSVAALISHQKVGRGRHGSPDTVATPPISYVPVAPTPVASFARLTTFGPHTADPSPHDAQAPPSRLIAL